MALNRLFCVKVGQLIKNSIISVGVPIHLRNIIGYAFATSLVKLLISSTFLNECSRPVSTTPFRNDLMEFFDDKKNWGATEVKSGRSWTKDELRLKSNTDLHRLWYVLLKEKNMLLTMEEECNSQTRLFPSPERIDKIEDSMENLETVVRERNRAYYLLETGETGERTVETVNNCFGMPEEYKPTEHLIPKEENQEYLEKQKHQEPNKDLVAFQRKMREKEYLENRRAKTRDLNHVIQLLNRFPNMDMEALKEKYPDVDIEKAKNHRKCHVHWPAN